MDMNQRTPITDVQKNSKAYFIIKVHPISSFERKKSKFEYKVKM